MFRDSIWPIRILGNLILTALVLSLVVWSANLFYEYDKSEFLEFSSSPKILNTEFQETHTVEQGGGFIIEYNLIKYEIGCYAEYQNTLVGPVSWQMPTRKSQFIRERGTVNRNQLRLFVEIPKTLPKGIYQIQLVVFPVCDGIPRDAFRLSNPTPTIRVE